MCGSISNRCQWLKIQITTNQQNFLSNLRHHLNVSVLTHHQHAWKDTGLSFENGWSASWVKLLTLTAAPMNIQVLPKLALLALFWPSLFLSKLISWTEKCITHFLRVKGTKQLSSFARWVDWNLARLEAFCFALIKLDGDFWRNTEKPWNANKSECFQFLFQELVFGQSWKQLWYQTIQLRAAWGWYGGYWNDLLALKNRLMLNWCPRKLSKAIHLLGQLGYEW